MSHSARKPVNAKLVPSQSGITVSLREIRLFAARIAEQFDPDQIILFGSHAYGTPHADSDVDLLVVMPTRNPIGQAVKIRLALPAPFSLDLLVRSPQTLAKLIGEDDWFLREVVSKGKVLYEKGNDAVDPKGRSRLPARQSHYAPRRAVP